MRRVGAPCLFMLLIPMLSLAGCGESGQPPERPVAPPQPVSGGEASSGTPSAYPFRSAISRSAHAISHSQGGDMQDERFSGRAAATGGTGSGANPDNTDIPTGGVMPKADLTKRFLAALIDGALGFVVSMVPFIGGLVAAAYFLCRDGLALEFMDGRSIGKKVMKLRPVRLDGQPMDLMASAMRNWMFALGGVVTMLLFIPILGWLLMIPVAFAGLALGIVEIFLVLTDPQGRRLGDKIAGSQVIEVES